MARDQRATLAALLRMRVENGCTPAEAASAREKALLIAERLRLNLDSQSAAEAIRRAAEKAAQKRAQEKAAQKRADAYTAVAAKLKPAEIKLVNLLRVVSGATAAVLGSMLGLEPHTIRGMISCIRAKGINIGSARGKDGLAHYHYVGK